MKRKILLCHSKNVGYWKLRTLLSQFFLSSLQGSHFHEALVWTTVASGKSNRTRKRRRKKPSIILEREGENNEVRLLGSISDAASVFQQASHLSTFLFVNCQRWRRVRTGHQAHVVLGGKILCYSQRTPQIDRVAKSTLCYDILVSSFAGILSLWIHKVREGKIAFFGEDPKDGCGTLKTEAGCEESLPCTNL